MEEKLKKINPEYFNLSCNKKIAPYVVKILNCLSENKELTTKEAKYTLNECINWIDDITLF